MSERMNNEYTTKYSRTMNTCSQIHLPFSLSIPIKLLILNWVNIRVWLKKNIQLFNGNNANYRTSVKLAFTLFQPQGST